MWLVKANRLFVKLVLAEWHENAICYEPLQLLTS